MTPQEIKTVILSLLQKLKQTVFKSEVINFPETQKVEVINPPAEVKIPEFPEIPEVNFESVIKAIESKVIPLDDSATKKQILNELQAIKTALSEPEEEDRTDDILEALNELLGAILSLRKEDKEIDLSPIVNEIKKIDISIDWSPLEKLTTKGEVNVKINAKQIQDLGKALGKSISVAVSGGGGNLRISSGEITSSNPLPVTGDSVATVTKPQAEQYAINSGNTAIAYQGWADVGTATSAANWRIRRITTTGDDVAIDWADGDSNYDNIWDNRESLSFS